MVRSPRRITTSTFAMVCAVALFAACTDRTGPATPRLGQLGIAPRYQSSAAALVDVAAIRILLVSTFDDRVALDTVITFPPGQDSVSLGFAVPLEQVGEEFSLFLRLIGLVGDTVFTSGPDVVRPAPGGATPTVVEPVLTYVGVGANAAAVVVTSPDTTLFFGGAVVLQAVALDPGQAPIPGTPIEWISLDPLVVVVPDADSGRVIAGTQRGTARIVARLLTGQADTVRVVAQPVPSAIAAESGGGQTAPGGGLLPQPLVARVTATDGLGVRGVWVRFAVTAGGGSLGADSVRTDSTGRASVTFQLGQIGPQTVQATTASLGGQFPSFAATVQAGPPAGIAIVAGNGQSAIAGSNVGVAPRVVVTDSAGRLVSGAPVLFSVTAGGGSIAGGTPTTGANGEAAVTGWTLGALAGPNALRAIVVAPPTDTFSVTFAATGIPGPASLLQLVSGDAQSDTAGATLAQPLVVRATDANGNGAPGVPIAWTATAGALGDDTVATDATGHAQVAWSLPATVGTPGATARIAGTAVTRGFTATVLPAAARRLVFVVQPSTVAQGAAIAPPVEVEVTDQFGNRRTADAGRTIVIAIGANPGGASLGGTPTGSTIAGVAAFANLTVSAFGNGYTLVTTSAGLVPDTSTAFTVLSPQGQVFWTNAAGGSWSAGANWSSGVPPAATDTVNITLAGTYTVTLDVNTTVAGLTLGAATGTQTLAVTGARTLTLTGDAVVNANGVIDVGSGDLTLAGGNVLAIGGGRLRVGAGRTLTLGAADFSEITYAAGTIGGPGTLRLTPDAQLNLAADLTLDSLTLVVEDGAVNRQGSRHLVVAPAATLELRSTVGVNVNLVVENQGTVIARGPQNFQNDSLINAAGAVLTVEGTAADAALTVNRLLQNAGVIELTQTQGTSSASLAVVPGTLRNLPGAVVISAAGAGSGARRVDAILENQGNVTVLYPLDLAVTRAAAAHTNAGVINVSGGDFTVTQTGVNPPFTFTTANVITVTPGRTFKVRVGTLDIVAPGAVTVAGVLVDSGPLFLRAGAFLQGSGTLDLRGVTGGSIAGDVLPAGSGAVTLTVLGNLSHTATSAYRFELGGTAAGQSDRLDVSGQAGLAGTLDASSLLGGYVPQPGDRIPVMTFASATGGFANLVFPAVGGVFFDTLTAVRADPVRDTLYVVASGPPVAGVVWTGAAGNGLWGDAGNWDKGRVPGATDTAFIGLDGASVTLNVGATVRALTVTGIGAQLTHAANTLQIDSSAVFGPGTTYAQSGGTLTGAGAVLVQGTLAWNGGTQTGSGVTTVALGASATWAGGVGRTLDGRSLVNNGSTAWASGGTTLANGATIVNNGTFERQGAVAAANLTGTGVFTNNRTFRKTGATASSIAPAFTNNDSVRVEGGTLQVLGGGTHAGPFTVAAGATLDLAGGTHALNGNVSGAGLVSSATAVTLGGGAAFSASGLRVTAGTLTLNGAVAVGDSIRVDNGAVVFQTPATAVAVPRLVLGGAGTIQGPDSLVVSGSFQWDGGTFATAGAVTRVLGTATWGGGAKTLNARTLASAAATNWSAGGVTFQGGAALVNSGVLDRTGAAAADFTAGGGSGSFTNSGTFRKSGTGATSIGVPFVNDNLLDVAAGTLDIAGAFTHSAPGVLRGTGTIDLTPPATVAALDGRIEPGASPGILSLTGAYAPGAPGVLAIELGGTTVGSQYDQLAVSGVATLGGTLNVTLINAFAPQAGDQFTVLTFASRTGDFATVNLPALAGGLTWQRSFTGTAMVLAVTNPFAGAPPGTDAVWIGAAGTSWTNAANWVPGIPGPTDDVFIRADATNPLTVTGVRTVDSLAVQTGALVTVSGVADTLIVGGSLDAGYPAIGGSGAVRLTGTSQSARGRVPNLAVAGTISAADSLIVPGNLAVTGSGDLNVGPRRVRVGGTLSTAGTATITMQNAAGRLDAAGSATFGGGSTTGRLTDGTFHLAGSLTQSGNAASFAPSGAHLTVLDGSGGTLTFASPAQAGGSHFHHLSVLMSGTASNGGQLVVNGNLIIQDTAQFAPSGIVGGSGNRITVVGSATIAQSRTAAVLTSDVLRFGGSVSRNAGAVVDGDTVEFFGTGQTVPTNLSSAFALKVTGDSVLFTGATTWRGMLVTGNGLADIGGATVAVDSTFRTSGSGRIRMTSPAAKLSVRGEARFEGGSTAGRMTAGTLDLGSHFSQAGLTSPSSFAPSGTHLTQFRNFDYVPGNPSVVPVTISMSNTFASFFRNLLIDQEVSATLPFHTVVTGSLTKPEFATLTGTALEVHGDLTAGGALNGIIDLDTAYVGGVFTPNLSSQDYRITVLVMTGAAQTLPSFPHYATVVVEGDSVVIAGGAWMGSLLIDGTGLADVGGAVQVNGSIETRDQGRLRMAGGSLFVGGNATFGGGSTAGRLTGGTLTVGGGFTQTGANSAAAFAASAGHVTEFINFDFRAVDFASPDSLASHFGTLSLGGAGELRLVSDVYAVGQLRTPAPAGGVVRTLSGLNLQGTRLVARGVDVDSLDLKALHLVVADGAPIGRLRDVRFVQQDPGVDRLALRRAGGTYTFERLTFTTPPDPGFAYVSVSDADGTAATPFHVIIDQASPADPGSFTRTDGVATLTWASAALLAGTVRNAVGGVAIFGATVDVKQGANAPQSDPTIQSTVTDESGGYSFSGLAAGDYTLWVSAVGFIDGSVPGITVGSGVNTVDVALSPLQQVGETRIVVSWGATPADLDSWLVVPDTVGGPPTYVSYGSPGAAASYPFSQLDNDVTTGYGPETITIYQQLTGTYRFRVHDYGAGDNAASTTLLASEARVDVYQNNELVQTFTVPNAPGTLWTVFDLNGGSITPINTMSGDSPASAIAGAATQLAFTVQPSNTGAGATITPPVQVAALDAFGAPATSFTGVVTVALGNGVLNGTTNVAAVSGVATFSDLSIDQPAPGYVLQAAVGSGGVQAAFSQFFDVTVPGQIGGTVRTAVGAAPIPGASVQLKQGANATTNDPVYQSTLTDVSGGYYFPASEGQYTLFFGASGQITTRVAGVAVTAGQTTTVAAGLTPPLSAGRTRVVLSWGGAPPELDAHLLGPDGLGGEFHVYYGTPGDSVASPFAVLHQDVGNGQGPEAVTIYAQQAGVYEFRVHDWVGGADPADTVLRTSGARVDVFQGSQQVQSFTVPYQLGTLWKVFQLNGSTITALNSIVGDPPGTPTGGGGFVALGLGDAASLNTSGAPRLGPPRTPR